MSQTVYIVTEINVHENSEEVYTAEAFSTKEAAISYISNLISEYEVDADSITVDEEKGNWYSDDNFDISLFESELD